MTQAVLLAAGLGTRLGAVTKSIPKCLVEVGGKPMLQHWLDKLDLVGCSEVFINTHHLAEQVEGFVGANPGKNRIHLVHEEQLLGTAGTLTSLRHLLTEDEVFVAHADNFFMDDLVGILNTHQTRKPQIILTMGVFESADPKSCGIVQVDTGNIVTGFDEKPSVPLSNLANAAVYIFSQEALSILGDCADLSTDFIPRVLGQIQAHFFQKPFFDIGTPASLAEARLAVVQS